MTEQTSFVTTLENLSEMQVPILTVKYLTEEVHGRSLMTKHIIVPSNNSKATDFVFVRWEVGNETLHKVRHLDMSFDEAIAKFASEVLKCTGAALKLIAL